MRAERGYVGLSLTREADQKQTTLEQLWSNSRLAQTRKRNRSDFD